MSRVYVALFALPLVVACAKEIPVAEGECSDLMKGVFRDAAFEGEDEESALQSLLLGLHERCVSVNADIDGFKDRSINPGPLTTEFQAGLPQPEGTDAANQTPIGLYGRSKHGIAKHRQGVVDPNQNCMGSNSTKYSVRTFTEGGDCFGDGSCDVGAATGRSYTSNPLAKVWVDSFNDFHHLVLPVEGDEFDVVISRNWADQSWYNEDGNKGWLQRYTLDLVYADPADPETSLRLYVFWSEAELGVGDDFYVSQVLGGLNETFDNTDSFFDGEDCGDRDKTEQDWR